MTRQSSEIPATVAIGDDLTVGRIGYGAMQLTGPKVWGEYPNRDQATALLRKVVASGVTFIDTADVYGPHSDGKIAVVRRNQRLTTKRCHGVIFIRPRKAEGQDN